MKIRAFSGIILIVWFVLVVLQYGGILIFGKNELSLSWILYSLAIYLLFVIIDFNFGFKPRTFQLLSIFIAADIIFFNLAIIYNWYDKSSLVNRGEHFFGSLLVCFVILGIIRTYQTTKNLSLINQSFIVIGIANFFGVFNEIVELFFDHFFDTENIGPEKLDTNLDLLMNFLAFVVFFIFISICRFLKKRESIEK